MSNKSIGNENSIVDSIKSHFDAYDFFALWGGGIIVLTYIALTMFLMLNNSSASIIHFSKKIIHFASDNAFVSFVFFSIIAYFFGLILHELGRWLFDIIGGVFRCESVSELDKITDGEKLSRASALFRTDKYASRLCMNKIRAFKHSFKKDYPNIELDDTVSVFYMETFLKNKGVAVGKKYSTYGLVRSIFIGSILNDLFVLIAIIKYDLYIFSFSCLFVLIISLLVSVVMFGRTYKSYLAYIRNLNATFYMAKIKNND